MRLLVSPGLPRSGTTYLFEQLAHRNRLLFNIPLEKETNFFEQHADKKTFLKMFRNYQSDRYFVDYTPSYLISRGNPIKNILRMDACEKKIIVHLRNPVDQIFAHYLHDIKSHIAKRQYGDQVGRILFDPSVIKKYLAKRASALKILTSELGIENILVINFHKDLQSTDKLTEKVSRFLGLDLLEFADQVVSPGGWLPYYVYGGMSGASVASGSKVYRVAKGDLLLVDGHETCLWHGVSPQAAYELILGSATWTRELSSEQFDILYNELHEDWLNVLSTLNQREESYQMSGPLTAKSAPLPTGFAAELEVLSDLGTLIRDASFDAGTR